MKTKVLIIGAGLSGLTLAYLLNKSRIPFVVLEARRRSGGRILTEYKLNKAPVELGATWFGEKHIHLLNLLEELRISTFPQLLGEKAIYEPISTSPPQMVTLPPNDQPSYRVAGGTSELIKKLVLQVGKESIFYDHQVRSIEQKENEILLTASKGEFKAQYVVSTIPPNLLINSVNISPELPSMVADICATTHTWMSESIKVAFRAKKPFWRRGSRGNVFSNVGPISELYDHSNLEDNTYALKGFLNGGLAPAKKEERKRLALHQLSRYYGMESLSELEYLEKVWRKDEFTHCDYKSFVLPHQNNGDKLFDRLFLKGRLIISGSETAKSFPGYMDGAVEAAIHARNRLLDLDIKLNRIRRTF